MQTWKNVFAVFLVIFLAGLFYLLAPILTPFLMGTLLAYLVNPLITRLMRWRLKRLTSVIIIFCLLLLVIVASTLLLIPLIQEQIDTVIILLPKAIEWIQLTLIPKIAVFLHSQEIINSTTIKTALSQQWSKMGSYAGTFLSTILQSGTFIIHCIINVIITSVVTFYLLRDWDSILENTLNLIPRHLESGVVQIAKECDAVLSSFIRGQFLVMLVIGLYYSIGLSLIGIDIGILLGIVLGAISIVPYLGFILGVGIASIAAYLQFGEWHPVLLVLSLFFAGQILDAIIITPKLIGDRIGLHPVAVILAVLAFGSLFGFFGVLLALPTAAVIRVWLLHLERRYEESQLYQ